MRVELGDTALVPRGVGTYGSRSTAVGGSAVLKAARRIREKVTRIAAYLLEASEEDVEWGVRRLFVRGSPERGLAWAEVAAAAYQPSRLPPGVDPGLDEVAYFCLPDLVYAYGAYGALTEVDVETGRVEIVKLVAVDDAGRLVNPLLAEGQILGGIAQGIGQAILEQVVHDADGQVMTSSLAMYVLPRATDVPPVVLEFLETPSPRNSLGAKGLGEAGAIGAAAAIANSVIDALGVRHLDMPFWPEAVRRVLRGGS